MRLSRSAFLGLWFGVTSIFAAPSVLNTNLQLRLLMNTAASSATVRICKDPRNNDLYYSKFNGDIYKVTIQPGTNNSTSTKVYSSSDHGITNNMPGMAIGPDGTMFVVGNFKTNGNNFGYDRIMKGVPNASNVRVWSLLGRTDNYPACNCAFDHGYNGLAVSPDGQYLYVNAGSRTDHGEIESNGGAFPNARDVALTAKILRLPANGSNLFLTNDLPTLQAQGYVFAEGTRNAFDFAFGPEGDIFATDNGPDRDMSDSVYWLQQGNHYGFPWRMGGTENPQQHTNYNPSTDKLLDSRYGAVSSGTYQNDPTFPSPPTNQFASPIINLGPDAVSYRDPVDGVVKNAISNNVTMMSVTAHRSPLGLVFDNDGNMASPFRHHGFMLSWTPGDPTGSSVAGPFKDPGADLLDLNLTKQGNTNYQMTATRIVGNFARPIDAEIISNKIYVVEYGGSQGLYEITFPPAAGFSFAPAILGMTITNNGSVAISFATASGGTYHVETTTNYIPAAWTTIPGSTTNADGNIILFIDPNAVADPQRFYRIGSP